MDSNPSPPSSADPETGAEDSANIATRDLVEEPATLESEHWPMRPWPASAGARANGFQALICRSVLNDIHQHGQSNADIEICGVLVGNVYRDDSGPYLLIDAIVRGDFAGSANAQVTFTAETWDHIQKAMESDHPDGKIVGWYHTHPSFGIFLSDMDLFIHGNFFNMPWQVAFVYDPSNGDEGIFLWRDGKTERGSFSIEEDAEKEEISSISVSPDITAAALADFSRRMQAMERRQRKFIFLGVIVLLIAVAWPFILFTILSDQQNHSRLFPASSESATTESGPSTRASTTPAATESATTHRSPSTEPVNEP